MDELEGEPRRRGDLLRQGKAGDLAAARDELITPGADVSAIWHGRGLGTEGHAPGPDPEGNSCRSFASFADPDGNSWLLEEIKQRLPGRE